MKLVLIKIIILMIAFYTIIYIYIYKLIKLIINKSKIKYKIINIVKLVYIINYCIK